MEEDERRNKEMGKHKIRKEPTELIRKGGKREKVKQSFVGKSKLH